jgi:Spy/CpxP family protein refolding chaperone
MKKHASFKKWVRMNKNRFAKRMVVGAGFFFLCAAPGLTRAQSSPPAPVQTPRMASPAARPKSDTGPTEDFAGLEYTNDQQAKIDQIHQNMKLRMDAVVKAQTLNAEQKAAMLQGLQRMERGEVYKVLTTEQQAKVRKIMLARRAAVQAETQMQSPPK